MYKLKLYGLITTLVLSGLIQGCAVERECGLEGCPGDAQITAHVQTQLSRHPELGSNAVDVQTLDHVVYLTGIVRTGLMRQTAADIAHQIPGVSRVENNIAVSN